MNLSSSCDAETVLTPIQFSFHRPLHELFAPFFQSGLVLDALEEVNFDETFRDHDRPHAARNFTQFPKILAFRMKLLGTTHDMDN